MREILIGALIIGGVTLMLFGAMVAIIAGSDVVFFIAIAVFAAGIFLKVIFLPRQRRATHRQSGL